jgi:hypothetical protein
MSGGVAANVPDSPQQRSLSAMSCAHERVHDLERLCVFIGVWQGSWYM